MATTLDHKALDHAERLIRAGKVVRDEPGDWSEHHPSTADENAFLEKHGWSDYAEWHLGIDCSESDETKGRFSFPFGDFEKVHRCGIIAVESRAAQFDHDTIRKAAKRLLDLIDGE